MKVDGFGDPADYRGQDIDAAVARFTDYYNKEGMVDETPRMPSHDTYATSCPPGKQHRTQHAG